MTDSLRVYGATEYRAQPARQSSARMGRDESRARRTRAGAWFGTWLALLQLAREGHLWPIA